MRPLRATSLMLLMAGCTNQPGALQLSVQPAKPEFLEDEPIQLNTTLVATGANICLAKDRRFAVELHSLDRRDEPPMMCPERFGLCGTGYMALWPLHPFFFAGSLLDVGDTAGRFDVLPRHGRLEEHITVIVCKLGEPYRLAVFQKTGAPARAECELWRAGEYVAKVRLVNEHVDFNPPPFFWHPYPHAVEAETRIRVGPHSR